MRRYLIPLAAVAALALPASFAHAGGRTSFGLSFGYSNYGYGGSSFVGVGIGRSYGYHGGYYGGGFRHYDYCAPRYYAPVYCPPPVVYYRPAPVYVESAPVVVASPPPVVYQAPPVVYSAPAPTVYQQTTTTYTYPAQPQTSVNYYYSR